METDAEEWRFQWIIDPKDGRKLFQIEHEVRSMKHRLFAGRSSTATRRSPT